MSENRFRSLYRTQSGASRPLILAHRGDSSHAPENTLESARLGLEAGADAWELDVRLTRDGHAVVIHDASLLRTTDVAARFQGDPRSRLAFPVDCFKLEEILELDAGSWFVAESVEPRSARGFGTLESLSAANRAHYGSGKVRIPTLVEALLWTLDQRWLVNVEIKPTNEDPKTLVNAVLNAIETTRAWDYVTISSFDHEVVNAVAIREPRLATGALIGGPLDQKTAAWLHRVKIDAVHGPPWSSDPSNDRPILVYTVNDAESGGLASRLADSGVAGLFTDDPSSLLRLFGLNRS